MKRVTVFLAAGLCAASVCFAQSVDVRTSAIPDKTTVGGEIRFFVRVERPKNFTLVPPSEQIALAPFEVKKLEALPFSQRSGRIAEGFCFTLTVFEVGDFQIPSFSLRYVDASGRVGEVATNPVRVKVVSVAKKKLTDKDDIRPIKGPISLDLGPIRDVALGSLAALLAVCLAVKVVLRRRKKTVDPESLKPPHERAWLELERLKARHLLDEGRIKEFYSELADVLRRYFERRCLISVFECTTQETLARLRAQDLEAEVLSAARDVLERSDLVKFAKFSPPRSMADELETAVREAIEKTKQIPEPVAEAPKP